MSQPTVLIVGAGIGGLSTAIHLARNNYQVTVIEKNAFVGGRCGQIVKDGHYFDIGPTFLVFPEIYKQMFASFGEKLSDYLELLRVDPAQQICFDDNTKLFCTSNRKFLASQLEEFEPGSSQGFSRFMKAAQVFHRLSVEKIISQDFQNFSDYFNVSNLLPLLKSGALENHHLFIKRFFKNPKLQAAFSFHDTYIGLNPYTSPAVFSMFPYSEFTHGVWLPRGGMKQVTEALVTIAKKNGVVFKLNCPVHHLVTDQSKVIKVVTSAGCELTADVIVANADLPYVYSNLLPSSNYSQRLKSNKYACSTITFFWGLKNVYPQLSTHNLFLAQNFKNSYDQVVNQHLVPQSPHFYVHAPTRTDINMAPIGQDTITVIVPVGHMTDSSSLSWSQETEKIRKFVIRRLEKFGLKNITQNIKFEKIISPPQWQDQFNLSKGTTLGLHHNLSQMGYLRPHRQHSRFKNLYFVGSNTHPGSGVPTVMLSALFTASQIFKTN
jgi:phytoene desaturase